MVLGRYELITQIGHGGMAEVQLALQRGPAGFEKLVVVKLVHENLATEKTFVDLLLDEARVAALVKHPNVVDIYDLGEADGRYFIAMEYLEGEPLLGLLRAGREGKRLDALSTARLIADTAEGLDAAHELRSMAGELMELVHHDVSLGNIVVLYNGQVKLVDFGVAKASQNAGPRMKVHGKFGYMAPEKLYGKPGDRRSDIWSLGVVLWESLTLRRLFRGSSDDTTIRQVLALDIVRPSTINREVPAALDSIVMRALERDPDRRYPRAKELARDLEEVLRVSGYGGRNELIANYMQSTFEAHISARKKLLQEVSSKGRASADVLEAAFSGAATASTRMLAGPRTIRPSGEFAVRFKRPTLEAPTPHNVMTEEGAPHDVGSSEVVERDVAEIIDRRMSSEEMIAEGTPSSVVKQLPIRRITKQMFAEATPIVALPEFPVRGSLDDVDLVEQPPRITSTRRDTAPERPSLEDRFAAVSERAFQPGVDGGDTVLEVDFNQLDDAPPVDEPPARPMTEQPTPSELMATVMVMKSPADVTGEPGAMQGGDFADFLSRPIEVGIDLDDEAKRAVEIARSDAVGHAIAGVLDRWTEPPSSVELRPRAPTIDAPATAGARQRSRIGPYLIGAGVGVAVVIAVWMLLQA